MFISPRLTVYSEVHFTNCYLSLFIFPRLTIYRAVHLTNCCLSLLIFLRPTFYRVVHLTNSYLSLFISPRLTIYLAVHLTNSYLSRYVEMFRKCLPTFGMVTITSPSRSFSLWRVHITTAESLAKKSANVWHACSKWHAENFPLHAAFTATSITLIPLPRPASLHCELCVCVCIQGVTGGMCQTSVGCSLC